MNPGVIGVFIPIILFLVIGMVLIASFYFRYREKQTLIDKGLDFHDKVFDHESIKELKEIFDRKRSPYALMKTGIVAIAFGIGLGLGLYLQDTTDRDYWIPFSMFVITGIGFVVANIAGNALESKNNK